MFPWKRFIAPVFYTVFLAAIFMAAPAARAADTIVSTEYLDEDEDGNLELIRIVMDENVTGCTYEAGDWSMGNSVLGISITGVTCSGANINVAITAYSEQTGNAQDPLLSYSNQGTAGSITLASGAMGNHAGVTVADGAKPQIWFGRYHDNDGDGKIDQIELSFTESMDGDASTISATDLTVLNAGSFTGIAFGNDTTDFAAGSNTLTINLGTEATAVATGDASEALSIRTQNNFVLADDAGNINNSVITITGAGSLGGPSQPLGFLDGAGPLIQDAVLVDSDDDGIMDRLYLMYTEDLRDDTTGTGIDVTSTANHGSCTGEALTVGPDDPALILDFTCTNEYAEVGDMTLTYDYDTGNVRDASGYVAPAQTVTASSDLAMRLTGALASANVEPDVLTTGLTSATVTFTPSSDVPADGIIRVTFGSLFNLTGVDEGNAACSSMDGTVSAAVEDQTVVITRQDDGTAQTAGAAETCVISDLTASAAGSTGVYSIMTLNAYSVPLDEAADIAADTLTAVATASGSRRPSQQAAADPCEGLADPASVAGLQAADQRGSGGGITLQWSDAADNPVTTIYHIFRALWPADSFETLSLLQSLPAATRSFTDDKVSAANAYSYGIRTEVSSETGCLRHADSAILTLNAVPETAPPLPEPESPSVRPAAPDMPQATPAAAPFPDIPEKSPYAAAIAYLKDHGVIGGYADGTFGPHASLQKTEWMKMLAGDDFDKTGHAGCFKDVQDQWFAPYVCYAKSLGWVQGHPDGNFGVKGNVNRAEALKMALEAFAVERPAIVTENPFPDVPKDAWFAPYVAAAKQAGLINPAWVRFQPALSVKRGIAGDWIYQLMNR